MRGYGLPRHDDVAHPDMGDIYRFGLKSCIGSVSTHGVYRGFHKNKRNKAQRRRYWAKKERRNNRIR